ncbi:hypothetical protein [Acinetobacter baumannii]
MPGSPDNHPGEPSHERNDRNNITRLEQLDRQSTQPFPNSRKVYLTGSRPHIVSRCGKISLADTLTAFGGEKNPPVFVYDNFRLETEPQGPHRSAQGPA